MVFSSAWGVGGRRQVQQARPAETFLDRRADPPKFLAGNAGAGDPDEIPPPGDPGPERPHRLPHLPSSAVAFHRAPDLFPGDKAAAGSPRRVLTGCGDEDHWPHCPGSPGFADSRDVASPPQPIRSFHKAKGRIKN